MKILVRCIVSLLRDLFLTSESQVDPLSSVSAAHGIGEKVRQEIHKSYPEIAEVFIHIGMALVFTIF